MCTVQCVLCRHVLVSAQPEATKSNTSYQDVIWSLLTPDNFWSQIQLEEKLLSVSELANSVFQWKDLSNIYNTGDYDMSYNTCTKRFEDVFDVDAAVSTLIIIIKKQVYREK